jgi:hypothetical protein
MRSSSTIPPVLEWPGGQPDAGEVAPLLLDLVDRGIVRILDIAFVTKDRDGSVSGVELGDLKEAAAAFAAFEGASSGLLGFDDLQEAAAALEPGHLGGGARLGEPLGRPGGRGPAPLGWPAGGQRPHPGPGRPGRARGHRSRHLTEGSTMPGLLRGIARTAVIAGTATAVSNRVSRRQAERWQRQGTYPYDQQPAAYEEPAPQYAPPPAPALGADPIQQLKDLAALRDQGVLTDEEFAAQKARILNS